MLLPVTQQRPRNGDKTRRSGEAYGDWKQFIEKLKYKWIDFRSKLFLSLAEEEMRLRREEFKKQVGTHGQHEELLGAMQRKGD